MFNDTQHRYNITKNTALVQVCITALRYYSSHIQIKSAMESEDTSTNRCMQSLRLHHLFCSYAYGKYSRQYMKNKTNLM